MRLLEGQWDRSVSQMVVFVREALASRPRNSEASKAPKDLLHARSRRSGSDEPTVTWARPLRRLAPPVEPNRVYRDRLALIVIRCWAAAACFFVLVVAGVPSLALVLRIAVVAVAAIAVWGGYRASNMCVATTPTGIWLGYAFWARWLPWEEVEGFTAVPWGLYREIRVKTRHRSKPYRAALVQGRKMFWKDGCTKDVLGALNSDLQAGRQGTLERTG